MKVLKIIVLMVVATSFIGCKTKELSVMTYNIRLDVASDGENAWPKRSNFLISQVLFLAPDIMGVQEAKPNQIKDLSQALSDYSYIGSGRDGDNKGEFSAIYYNTKKLKVDNADTFWLSTTPDKTSKGWDAAYPRICTYGLFTFLKTGEQFWIFNTHLDHKGAEAQKEGMKLILKQIKKVNTKNLPVLLTGDFNVEPNSELIQNLKNEMLDSKEMAEIKFGSDGTFNGFQYSEPVTRRIDYIFFSESSKIYAQKYGVLSSAIDFKYPSDHFPVFVKFSLK